jgi:hypothetical protein
MINEIMDLNLKSLCFENVVMTCHCGSEISECISEAIMIAMKLGCMVTFNHNDREYVIDRNKILQSIGFVERKRQ